jgi:hypothetical protein
LIDTGGAPGDNRVHLGSVTDPAAPRVFISYAHDSPAHKNHVRGFATYLQAHVGLDVRFDQWDDSWRLDWSLWATEQLNKADFIVVIASPEYRKRGEGAAPSHEGRGSQFETAIIRNKLTEDLRRETRRVLPVVLPGGSIEDIPAFLNPYSTTHFVIRKIDEEGVAALLAAITGHGQHPMPERGRWRDRPGDPADRTMLLAEARWLGHSPKVQSGSASIDGVRYEHSILLRPTAAPGESWGFVEIELGGAYERLATVVGVLDDAAETFQIGHFEISVDGKRRWTGRVALGKPAHVEVTVTGALKLRLEMYRLDGTSTTPRRDGGLTNRLPALAWAKPYVR